MSRTYENLLVKNSSDLALVERGFAGEGDVRQETVNFFVDTGSDAVYLPEACEKALGLTEIKGKMVTVGGGRKVLCKVLSPVEIWWRDRFCTLNPFVMQGQETAILGLVALEDLALKVDPAGHKLEPAYPDGIMGQLLILPTKAMVMDEE
jgi:predicted aspartyl protease